MNNINQRAPYNEGSFYIPEDERAEENVEVSEGKLITDDMKTYKLKHPVEFEGVLYEEIVMDFENLTGRDIEEVVDSINVAPTTFLETNKKYLAALAMKAAKLPQELMMYVKAKDYTAITLEAQNFILE